MTKIYKVEYLLTWSKGTDCNNWVSVVASNATEAVDKARAWASKKEWPCEPDPVPARVTAFELLSVVKEAQAEL